MYYVGVDIGGTNIAIGICDGDMNIVKKGSCPTLASRPVDKIIADLASLTLNMLSEAGLKPSDIAAAGLACPGTVDPETGIVIYANNIAFSNYPLTERFTALTGIAPAFAGNDANIAAFGEACKGAAVGAKSSVMITLGTGVGGGVVIDGKLITGCASGGAELGHIVIEYGGRQCTCGRRGCFEAYSSASALVAMTKEAMEAYPDSIMHKMVAESKKISAKTAFIAARAGDKAGIETVEKYENYLACGIANLINIFQPDVLLIGGGVCNEGDNLMLPVIDKVKREIYAKNATPPTRICIAALGSDAGIIGAAAYAAANSHK